MGDGRRGLGVLVGAAGGDGATAAGRAANASISRLVTEGASSASPAAATRIAAARSARGASFSRNPLAPARSASYT